MSDGVWRMLRTFFVCAALQLDLTVICKPDCRSGAAVANLGSLGREVDPPSHSLTCHSWSAAGAVLGWIDDPGRAWLLHTRYAEVVEVGQIVGTRNTAQHQNMQRKNATRDTVDWVSRVFESSAKGCALSMGEKRMKMERPSSTAAATQHGGDAWRLEQAGPGRLGTKIGH